MIELKVKTITPAELKPGHIVCGDDGVPFAVLSVLTTHRDGSRTAETREIPPGPFDVRGFSNDHRFMRTNGCTGVTVLPSYPLAMQWQAREMAARSDDAVNIWRAYSAVYFPDTLHLARVSEFPVFLPINFPVGTDVTVVDCDGKKG